MNDKAPGILILLRLMAVLFCVGSFAGVARAEGTWQMGLFEGTTHLQYLYETNTTSGYNDFNVDVLSAGEVISVHTCGLAAADNIRVQIDDPAGNSVYDNTAAGTICNSDLNTTFDPAVTNPHQYTTTSSGTYVVRMYNQSGTYLSRYDVTVTNALADLVDPRDNGGRVWSLYWAFNAGTYNVDNATDANLYVVADGGFIGTHFVWRLDLNNFAGFVYSLTANDLGVDSPNAAGDVVAGISVPTANNSVQTKYPIYLAYPAKPFPRPVGGVNVSGLGFIDSDGEDSGISPGSTNTVQDTGTFTFNTNLTTSGVYEIVIDNSSPGGGGPDGVYGQGDIFLRGNAVPGVNSVDWNGEDNNGNIIPMGAYTAKLGVRTGEFHFTAQDVETSGGPGEVGIKIYRAEGNGLDLPATVYWDDATVLNSTATDAFNQEGIFDGNHSWGNFGSGGIGNNTYIDTYAFGRVEEPNPVGVAITDNDIPLPTIVKSFSPSTITTGATSTLQLQITYNGILPLTGVTLQDIMPQGMSLVSAANSISVGGAGCTGFAFSAATVVGGNLIEVVDGNIDANSVCTITADVTADLPGELVNTTSGLQSNELATGVVSNGASLFVQPMMGGTQFSCNASLYESETIAGSTRLFNIDNSVLPYTRSEFGGASYAPTADYTFTGLAHNPHDNYLYGIVDSSVGGAGVPLVGSVVRIDLDGNIVNLGVPVRGPNTMKMPVISDRFSGGTIAENGRYVVVTDLTATAGSGANIPVIERGLILDIDLSSSPPQVLFNRRHGRDIGDVVAHPDGTYYSYNPVEGLISIDPATGAVGQFGGDLTDTVSGLMADPWGMIYALTDAGNLHSVDVQTGNATLLSAVAASSTSDGASCPFGVGVRKTVAATDVAPGSAVGYTISVVNQSDSTATFTLTDSLADARYFVDGTLSNPFGGTVNTYASEPDLIISAATLAANSSADLQVSVFYPANYPQGSAVNQVSVNDGTFTVLSDDPASPQAPDATSINVLPNPSLGVAKSAVVNDLDVSFEILLKNAGNTLLSNISFTDDLDAVFGAGNYVFTLMPSLIADPGSILLNSNYDGSSDITLINMSDAASLAIDDSAIIRFAVRLLSVVDTGAGVGSYSNQVEVFFEDPDGNTLSDLSMQGDDPDPDGNGFPDEQEPTLASVAQIIIVQGSVFNDNGASGGVSHNAIQEAGEVAFDAMQVQATDGSAIIATAVTAGDGSFQLVLPGSYGNTAVQIELPQINSFYGVSEFFAQDPGNTGAITDSVVGFTPQLSHIGVYEIDFGLVNRPVWESDSIAEHEAGMSVVHSHRYHPQTSGDLVISTGSVLSSPNNTAWQTTLVEDANCNGSIDAGEPTLPSVINVDVDSTPIICVLSKIIIPADANRGDSFTVELIATLTYSDAATTGHGLTDSRLITDLTTVLGSGGGRLSLTKTVQNLTTSGQQSTANVAVSGDTLRYVIQFTNTGSGPVTEVLISDSTPSFTELSLPVQCPGSMPPAVSSCQVVQPGPAANVAGYSGPVQWQFNGSLAAGGSGDVSYEISVE